MSFSPSFDTTVFLNKEFLKTHHHPATRQPKKLQLTPLPRCPREQNNEGEYAVSLLESSLVVAGVDIVDGFHSLLFSQSLSFF